MFAVIAVKSNNNTHAILLTGLLFMHNVVSTVATEHNGEEGTTRKASDATSTGRMYEIYCSVSRGTNVGMGVEGVEDVDAMTVIGKHR